MTDLARPDHARSRRNFTHSDQGEPAGGIQVVSDGSAFVGRGSSGGFSVPEVRDPRPPKLVRHPEQSNGTRAQHLKACGDTQIVNDMKDTPGDAGMKTSDDWAYMSSLPPGISDEERRAAASAG